MRTDIERTENIARGVAGAGRQPAAVVVQRANAAGVRQDVADRAGLAVPHCEQPRGR